MLDGIRALRGGVERVGSVMADAAGWVFVLCALFVTFDVFSRAFLGFSTKATTELTGYMLAFGITWGLTHALATKAHVRVDVLVMKLPLKVRSYFHGLALGVLTFVGVFFAWRGWNVVQESVAFNARDTSALTVPLVIPQTLWALGLTAFAILAVVMLVEVLLLLALGRREQVDQLLGPRSLAEETADALEAASVTPAEGSEEDALVAEEDALVAARSRML